MSTSHILALDSSWEPHRWISVDDAMIYEYKHLVQARLGESVYIYRGGKNKITGEISVLQTSSIIVLKGESNSTRRYKEPALTNESLFARDRYVCAYCGSLFAKQDLTRDHVHPVSKGGKDKWMNVVSSCKPCNNLKDDTMPGEKLPKGMYSPSGSQLMEILYIPYVPCKAENMILRNRKIKYDQMEYLLSRVKNKDSRIFKYAEDYKKSGNRSTWKELR